MKINNVCVGAKYSVLLSDLDTESVVQNTNTHIYKIQGGKGLKFKIITLCERYKNQINSVQSFSHFLELPKITQNLEIKKLIAQNKNIYISIKDGRGFKLKNLNASHPIQKSNEIG